MASDDGRLFGIPDCSTKACHEVQRSPTIVILLTSERLGKMSQPFVDPGPRRGKLGVGEFMDRGELVKPRVDLGQGREYEGSTLKRRGLGIVQLHHADA